MEWLSSWVWGESDFLTRDQFIEFAKLTFKLLDEQEVKDKLKQIHTEGGDVMTQITEYQKQIFKSMDIPPDFGLACLSTVAKKYSGDREVIMSLQMLAQRESIAMDEAELSPEDFKKKVDQMKAMQQQMMEKMKKQQEEAHAQAAKDGSGHSHDGKPCQGH